MIKIYLDNCCYNRPFDDLSQEKNYMEASAIEIILNKYINREIEIFGSMAIEFEILKISNGNKKRQVEDLYDVLELQEIEYSDKIINRAKELRKYNIKEMDALHIAFVECGNVDYMITTDKKLINASKKSNAKIKIFNPVKFIMEVNKKWQYQ